MHCVSAVDWAPSWQTINVSVKVRFLNKIKCTHLAQRQSLWLLTSLSSSFLSWQSQPCRILSSWHYSSFSPHCVFATIWFFLKKVQRLRGQGLFICPHPLGLEELWNQVPGQKAAWPPPYSYHILCPSQAFTHLPDRYLSYSQGLSNVSVSSTSSPQLLPLWWSLASACGGLSVT